MRLKTICIRVNERVSFGPIGSQSKGDSSAQENVGLVGSLHACGRVLG